MVTAAMQTDEERRAAWLEVRRHHITSTDLGPIMGLPDAFGSAMGVYLEKTQRSEESGELPELFEWGQRLQHSILCGYSDRVGEPITFADPYTLLEVPGHPLLGASLDARWSAKDQRPVDAKNVGRFDPRKWGGALTDEIPGPYILQLHAQMDATGTRVADLAVLFSGCRQLIYRVERDDEVIAAIREAAERFWHHHVQADIPPPVDASTEWTRFLASRKQTSDQVLEADDEATHWALVLRAAKNAKNIATESEAEAANHLRAIIGEHAGLTGSFGRISNRANQDSIIIDHKRICIELSAKLVELAPSMQEFVIDICKQCTTTKPGNRPLRPTWVEEKE